MIPRPTLAIIGYGQFGRFLFNHLHRRFRVRIHDPAAADALRADGLASVPIEEAGCCRIIVLAVPVQDLESVARRLGTLAPPGTLFVDVASVKLEPVRILSRALPAGSLVAYTHPLFGPTSAPGALDDKPLALCSHESSPVNTRRLARFLARRLRLNVIECTPEHHDRQMASVQGLTHFLAQSLRLMNLPDDQLATVAYQHLLALARNLTADSWPLFVTIATHNPYAAEVRREFLDALHSVEDRLRSGS
jgi:prephenate dehydrogenase